MPMPLGDADVHVWYVFSDRAADADLLRQYEALLTDEERARWRRFAIADKRHEFLVARALVRTTLSRYASVEPVAWRFAPGPHGKPEIATPPALPLRFNLSHTRGLVACAVARDREIGVDVEDMGRRPAPLHLARRYFAPPEVAHLESLSAERQPEVFFDFWTLKEGYLKARGVGLGLPLHDFWFHLAADRPPTITFAPSLDDNPSAWQFAQARPSECHKLSLAVRVSSAEHATMTVRETLPLAGDS
jgi:4'-phosphopantetheinyl transferase